MYPSSIPDTVLKLLKYAFSTLAGSDWPAGRSVDALYCRMKCERRRICQVSDCRWRNENQEKKMIDLRQERLPEFI